MIATRQHKGWYRPRNLPHCDAPLRPQFVTFRLSDSLPAHIPLSTEGESLSAKRRRLEKALDACWGKCWLAQAQLAEIVCDGLAHGCGRTHDLHAFVVMPNHVHVLATLHEGARLCDVVRGWKSYSARRINTLIDLTGAFWRRDYFDRYVRDEAEFERVRVYIENNPASAGLTNGTGVWRFSSTAWR